MNKVILMGRLTADPEYKQTQQGTPLCHFSIAVDRPFSRNNNNPNKVTADFFRVTAWNYNADFVSRYFTKGNPIIVEGSIRNDNYTDKNGVTHYSVNIQADRVYFCLTNNRNNVGNGYQQGSYGKVNYSGDYASQGSSYYQQPQQMSSMPPYPQPVNSAPAQSSAPTPNGNGNESQSQDLQVGQLDEFEEILSDGEIPF